MRPFLAVFVAMCLLAIPMGASQGAAPAEVPFEISGTTSWDSGEKSSSLNNWEVETYNDNLCFAPGVLGLGTRMGENFTYDVAEFFDGSWKLYQDPLYVGNDQYIEDGRLVIVLSGDRACKLCAKCQAEGNFTYVADCSYDTNPKDLEFRLGYTATTLRHDLLDNTVGILYNDGVNYAYVETLDASYYIARNNTWYTFAHNFTPDFNYLGAYPGDWNVTSVRNGTMANYSVYFHVQEDYPRESVTTFCGYAFNSVEFADGWNTTQYYTYEDDYDLYRRSGNWTSPAIGTTQAMTSGTAFNFTFSNATESRCIDRIEWLDTDEVVFATYDANITDGSYENITEAQLTDGSFTDFEGFYFIRVFLAGDGNGTAFIEGIDGSDGIVYYPVDSEPGAFSLPTSGSAVCVVSEVHMIIAASAVLVAALLANKKRRRRR